MKPKKYLIIFTTHWGFKHGGINSFNFDFCLALAKLIINTNIELRIVSLNGTETIQSDKIKALGAKLFSLNKVKAERYELSDIARIKLYLQDINNEDSVIFVGHDVFTGEMSNLLRGEYENSQSVVFHHMNYEAYYGIKGNISPEEFQAKLKYQRIVLKSADTVVAVGPKLLESANEKTNKQQKKLLPGLQSINPKQKSTKKIKAITFGRYDLKTDKLKQMRLAVEAYIELLKDPQIINKQDSMMKVVGISSLEESQELIVNVNINADRYANIIPLPYTENREDLFEELSDSTVALMLSVHEGFGLTGYEAIAAEVPLIITENSGLFQFLSSEIKAENWMYYGIHPIHIKGQFDNSLNLEDKNNVVIALKEINKNFKEYYTGIKKLRKRLLKKFTWDKTATDFLTFININVGSELNKKKTSQNTPSKILQKKSKNISNKTKTPYLPHPYAIVKNFTGRKEELTKLSNWFFFEEEPIYIIEAIGGMGKSALCWKWLQSHLSIEPLTVEGIIWWSFYDQGFEEFVYHLHKYCVDDNLIAKVQRTDAINDIINVLGNHRFLIILDGFERVLRGYAKMMGMYMQESGLSRSKLDLYEPFDVSQRTPITPKAEKFLLALSSSASKTLITSRLYPATLEDITGVKHTKLEGLSKEDTISFFKSEKIIGTDEEIINAAKIYGFHPLMLKLLSSAVKRSFIPHLKRSLHYTLRNLINRKEPQKILITSYQLLNSDEQKVATALAVFRTSFTINSAKSLFSNMHIQELEEIMMELYTLGFILYNNNSATFDFHPILRSYLYSCLTDKTNTHQLALEYFSNIPLKEKIVTFSDLEPIIEQYYHLAKAERYDEAYRLFVDLLVNPVFYQLAQYDLCISFCEQLLESTVQLSEKYDESYILNLLGLCYSYTGQLEKAEISMLSCVSMYYERANYDFLSVGLSNLSWLVYVPTGQFMLAEIYLRKAIFEWQSTTPYDEAYNFRILGNILTAKAVFQSKDDMLGAEEFLQKAIDYCVGHEEWALATNVALEFSKLELTQITVYNKELKIHEAATWSLKAMNYANRVINSSNAKPSLLLSAYESIARVIITSEGKIFDYTKEKIFFYDDDLKKVKFTMTLSTETSFKIAELSIYEGLTISRKTNWVYNECIFLFLLAKYICLKTEVDLENPIISSDFIKLITDAHILAIRINYRIFLADLHLFCANLLIKYEKSLPVGVLLLNIDSTEHIKKAREYSLDISNINNVFSSGDMTEFYNNVPQYSKLENGMSLDDRKRNGYYAVWLEADKLEQKL